MAHAYRHAEHRAQLAAEIAKAYIEVRRLQEVLALREALQSQYAGNAEIAAFRREAGLVSGIDAGLAGSLLTINATGLDTTRLRYTARSEERRVGTERVSTCTSRRMPDPETKKNT